MLNSRPKLAVCIAALFAEPVLLCQAQSITIVPAPIEQPPANRIGLSGDGSTLFGNESRTDAFGVQNLYAPWRWSARSGVVHPALPQGTNGGLWNSWSANGDAAILRGLNYAPNSVGFTGDFIVNAAGAAQIAPEPFAGYHIAAVSGDGQTFLYYGASTISPNQPNGFALQRGATLTTIPCANPDANAIGTSLSHDGAAVGGGIGSYVNGAPRLTAMRWSGTPSAHAVSQPLPEPAAYISSITISPDGQSLFGALMSNDLSHVLPFLYSESRGFEVLPQIDPVSAAVVASSFDASTLLINDATVRSGLLWQRGIGITPMDQYLSSRGVDLSGFSNLRVDSMSYDSQVFAGSARIDGQYVALLITVPAPATALCPLLVSLSLSRRRR